MILGAIFLTFYSVVSFLIAQLPIGGGLPTIVIESIIALGVPLGKVSWFLPVIPILNVLLWVIALRTAIFAVGVINFGAGLIRGSGHTKVANW